MVADRCRRGRDSFVKSRQEAAHGKPPRRGDPGQPIPADWRYSEDVVPDCIFRRKPEDCIPLWYPTQSDKAAQASQCVPAPFASIDSLPACQTTDPGSALPPRSKSPRPWPSSCAMREGGGCTTRTTRWRGSGLFRCSRSPLQTGCGYRLSMGKIPPVATAPIAGICSAGVVISQLSQPGM